jgi:short-subunit dehydrogenase
MAAAAAEGARPSGHIVNVLSVWAHEVPRREYTHFYSATKHALRTVAEGLRIELAARRMDIKVTYRTN